MKQQLILTMCFISNCPVWLIDEPLTGLDPTNVYVFNRLLSHARENGHCILMSSHNLTNAADICTRVLFLKNGAIVEDVSDKQEKELDAIYREHFFLKEAF